MVLVFRPWLLSMSGRCVSGSCALPTVESKRPAIYLGRMEQTELVDYGSSILPKKLGNTSVDGWLNRLSNLTLFEKRTKWPIRFQAGGRFQHFYEIILVAL